MKTLAFLFCLLISLNSTAQGIIDGFIDNPKAKALALSISHESSDTYFLWNRDLDLPISSFTASLFYKHQLTKNLGYVASIPFINGTPQDGSLFLKYGVGREITKNFKINAIAAFGGSHPLSNYSTESSKAIGQQAKSIGFRTVAQLTFKNTLFINGRFGMNFNSHPTPDNTVASIKIGFYKNKWYADFWIDRIEADGGKDYRGLGDNKAESFRELGFDADRVGGVVYHQTSPKIGLFISGSYTINGRNAYKISRVSGGAVWKF